MSFWPPPHAHTSIATVSCRKGADRELSVTRKSILIARLSDWPRSRSKLAEFRFLTFRHPKRKRQLKLDKLILLLPSIFPSPFLFIDQPQHLPPQYGTKTHASRERRTRSLPARLSDRCSLSGISMLSQEQRGHRLCLIHFEKRLLGCCSPCLRLAKRNSKAIVATLIADWKR